MKYGKTKRGLTLNIAILEDEIIELKSILTEAMIYREEETIEGEYIHEQWYWDATRLIQPVKETKWTLI